MVIANSLKIRQLTQASSTEFRALWSDGHAGRLTTKCIRDSCPCAECKGETVLMKSYLPPPADKTAPGRYVVKAVEMVGGYAMKFTWGDGHSLGLYTWELLRSLCECELCMKERE
jgi:DUF971 family protein